MKKLDILQTLNELDAEARRIQKFIDENKDKTSLDNRKGYVEGLCFAIDCIRATLKK